MMTDKKIYAPKSLPGQSKQLKKISHTKINTDPDSIFFYICVITVLLLLGYYLGS